jgi:hypothetical protein
MPDTGAVFTGTGANFNDGGNLGWTNPTNVEGDTTSTAATVQLGTNGHISQQLRCTNFGLSVPDGATIDGVLLSVELASANNSRQYEHTIQLLKAGTASGDNLSTGAVINNSKSTRDYGGSTALWGTSLSRADVIDSGFGALIKVVRSSAQATTTSIYRASITVFYSIPPATQEVSGEVSFSTTQTVMVGATRGGTLDFAGSLDTSYSSGGTVFTQELNASFDFAADQSKGSAVTRSGSLDLSGQVLKSTSRQLSASLGPSGSIVRRTLRSLQAAFDFTGSSTKGTSMGLSASLSPSVGFTAELEGQEVILPALTAVVYHAEV